MRDLGYYVFELTDESIVLEYINRAIRDFEREKKLFLTREFKNITYYCPKCLFFVIDYAGDYEDGDTCHRCGYPLRHIDKLFVKRYSKLLSKYRFRVKPLIRDLFRLLGEYRAFSIFNYSMLYIRFSNYFTEFTEIFLHPMRVNSRFTMFLSILLDNFNTEYLDIIEKIEELFERYRLMGFIGIFDIDLSRYLLSKGYRESAGRYKYTYTKNIDYA